MLDVHALDRADALGEDEGLGLGEGRRGEEAALALPDERRVEALLDRRPDGERRREVEALDHEVRAVADADLVDVVEEVVGGVAGEDVAEARLHADADEREAPRLLPRAGHGELRVAEHHAGVLVRGVRVRLGEGHRHVEVGDVGFARRAEDRRVQARVARVEHHVGPLGGDELDEGRRVARVAAQPGDPRVTEASRRGPGAPGVHVGEDDRLEEVAVAGDRGGGDAHAARADDEDAHGRHATRRRMRRCGAPHAAPCAFPAAPEARDPRTREPRVDAVQDSNLGTQRDSVYSRTRLTASLTRRGARG